MDNDGTEQSEQQEMNNTKTALLNTRTLDNHYDPRIHEKAWIAPGHLKDYKYNYSDSGLGYTVTKPLKMKNFKERHEQVKEVEDMYKKTKGFRHFREYDNVLNNEIVITIEYCTNCRHHQGSTRHDEEKYAYFANTLKREIITSYPIVKVILKPLIFEQNDESSEAFYLRSRIGALEVQIFSKNSKGEIKTQIVFSKLKTRSWPSISKVIEDITKFLPTDDFIVRLIDPNSQPEENKYEGQHGRPASSKKSGQPNKLKGLHVIIRPLKSGKNAKGGTLTELSTSSKIMGDTSRYQGTGTSRPTSAIMRPQSAYSTTSSKSTTNIRKGVQGNNENYVPNSGSQEYVEQADNFGVVLFKQIPHNIYEIELLETQNYLPDKKVVNVFELVEQGAPLTEEFILREQTMGFTRIRVTEKGMPFEDSSVIVAKKNPDPSSKTAVLREKDPKTGVFEFMIDPGQYVLLINKLGYPERREEVNVDRGVNEFAYEVTNPPTKDDRPSSRQRPTSSKGRHDSATSGSKLQSKNLDVIPQENEEHHSHNPHHHQQQQQPMMGMSMAAAGKSNNTDDKSREHEKHETEPHSEAGRKNERVKSAMVKKVEFSVHDVDTEKPLTGALIILEEIGFRGTTNELGKCFVPVNKLNSGKLILSHDDYFGMVEEYGGEEGADLKSGSEKKFYLIPRPTDVNEVQLRFLPANGVKCAKFSVLHSEQGEAGKKDVTVKHGDDGKEIIILKNLLKKHGVFRIIAEISDIDEFLHPESTFILSHYEDCDPLYIFPPAENMLESSKLIWDVGFFADPEANPQFVEINGYSNKPIILYSHLKEYQLLLNYLHNSKSDLKTLLGFKDKNRIERDGDIFISKETIYASLDKYGLEIKNVDHLLSSARSVEGLYSYRECERRFGNLRPPFNFIEKAGHGHEDGSPKSSDGGEEEYLFEDDN